MEIPFLLKLGGLVGTSYSYLPCGRDEKVCYRRRGVGTYSTSEFFLTLHFSASGRDPTRSRARGPGRNCLTPPVASFFY